jgi:hypothetical protein
VEQCDGCKYCRERVYGTSEVYECRHDPPTAQGQLGQWPQVQATDWCGKWEAIAATKEREYRALGEIPL